MTSKVDDFIIKGSDISNLFNLASERLSYAELIESGHFQTTASCAKLLSVFVHYGSVNGLRDIVRSGIEHHRLSDVAALEAQLYLCAVLGADPSKQESDSVSIVAGNIAVGSLSNLTPAFDDANLLYRMTVIKYLCMWGHLAAVRGLLSRIDTSAVNCICTHLVSIGTLFGQKLAHHPEGELLRRWKMYFQTVSNLLWDLAVPAYQQFKDHHAFFLSDSGDHDKAAELIQDHAPETSRLWHYVNIGKSIQDKSFKNAIRYADTLITLDQGNQANIVPVGKFNRDIAETALREANTLLRQAGVDVFIISGTLLGCVRDGRILEYDKDFDFGVIGWERQFDIARALLISQDFSMSAASLRGHELFLFSVVHVPTGYSFDIFFFHPDGDFYKHGIELQIGFTIHYRFSKFTLKETEFLGQSFLVPENHELFLSENYGPSWRTPDPDYFVKMESPALIEKSGDQYAFSVRHEMLDMLGRRVSLKKGKIFVEKMKQNVRSEDQPKPSVVAAFLNKLKKWEAASRK